MPLYRLALASIVIASPALAKPAPPSFSRELAECQNRHGTQPAIPVATDYHGGLSKKGNALTPAELTGVTTVSPKAAACMIEAMGDELVVVAPMKDEEGVQDAWAVQGLGWGSEPTEEEWSLFNKLFARMSENRPERPFLVYCHHTRCFLSYNALIHLKAAGYTNLLWMREGMEGWKAAGLPVGLTRENGFRRIPQVDPPQVAPTLDDADYPTPLNFYSDARYEPLKTVGLDLFELCSAIKNSTPHRGEPPLRYEHELHLYRAAGVDPKADNQVTLRRKMHTFWRAYGDILECRGSMSTDAIQLLKFAVKKRNTALPEQAIEDWTLPTEAYNKIDYSDGRTLLDFVINEYNSNSSAEEERAMELRSLYRELRNAGARTRDELVEGGKWKTIAQLQSEFLPAYRKRAEAGEIPMMLHMGGVYCRGIGVPKDDKLCLQWHQRAEARAIETAAPDWMVGFGMWHYFAEEPSSGLRKRDPAKAFEWFSRAQKLGSRAGAFWLGRAYAEGVGVRPDPQLGLKYLKEGYYESSLAASGFIAGIYIDLGDHENAGLYLRNLGDLNSVKGASPGYWMKKLGIPTCGKRGPPFNDLIGCEGKSAEDIFK